MQTHYHLILEVGEGALAVGMQALNFRYAMAYNQRHRMKGHVHGRRYGSRRIADDGDLLGTFRYVMRNPVEAFLCNSPVEWPWSSCASTLGLAEPQPFVNASRIVGCADGPLDLARAALRSLVEAL